MRIMPTQAAAYIDMALMMIIMSIVLVVMLFKKGVKTFLIYTVVFIAILGLFRLYVARTCGPNPKDVAIMKPMAEKISEYIIKNGIPKSLKDISGLPYELEGCKRKQENLEKCIFYKDKKKFEIEIYIMGEMDIEAYSFSTETGLRYELKHSSNNKSWIISGKDIVFSSKTDGICNPMRQ